MTLIDSCAIESAKATDLATLVSSRVKLQRRGRALWGRCPFHAEKSPSFKVENGRYHCFGCGADGDVIQWMRATAGLPFHEAVSVLTGDGLPKAPRIISRNTTPAARDINDKERTARAIAIWKEAVDVGGTIAERYLRKRIGGDIPKCANIRFHNSCPRGTHRLPALVTLLCDAVTNEPLAIQRVFLQPDGSDRLRDSAGKLTLGPARGAVVKLTPDESVTNGLGISEGIEKSIALLAVGWAPIWATLGTSIMTGFPVLDGIESLTVFADGDEAGQKAATACAGRWADAGREVVIRTPNMPGLDWDDALKEAA